MARRVQLIFLVYLAISRSSGSPAASGGLSHPDDTKVDWDELCPSPISIVPSISKCLQALHKDLNRTMDTNSAHLKSKTKDLTMCCALNNYQDCLVADVRVNCGRDAEKQIKEMVTAYVIKLQVVTEQLSGEKIDCHWDQQYECDTPTPVHIHKDKMTPDTQVHTARDTPVHSDKAPPASGELPKDKWDELCPSPISIVPAMKTCLESMEWELDPINSMMISNDTKDGKIQDPTLCCALNNYQDCLLADVRVNCGKNAEQQIKEMVTAYMIKLKVVAEQLSGEKIDCQWGKRYECDTPVHHHKHKSQSPAESPAGSPSPSCWSAHGKIIGWFILLTLLLAFAGYCYYLYRRNHGGKIQPLNDLVSYASNLPLIGTERQGPGPSYERLGASHTSLN